MSFERLIDARTEGEQSKELATAKILVRLAENASTLVEERLRTMIINESVPVDLAVSLVAQRIREVVFADGCTAFSIGDSARRAAVESLDSEHLDE